MAYTIEIENNHVFLRQSGRNLGVVELNKLELKDRTVINALNKIKFSKVQQESYDFSRNVTAYTKKGHKNKVFFNFVTDNCEISFNAEDGKIYDMFNKEIPIGKVNGNFMRVDAKDENSKNLIKYLRYDILNGTYTPSMKTALQKIKYDSNLENIQKIFLFGVYLSRHDLTKIELKDVTKDVVNMLKDRINKGGGNISTHILATAHYSKKYHESYIKYLEEDNKLYFEFLYTHKDKYDELVNFFKYDEISLIDYITRIVDTQNLELRKAIEFLYDYANIHNIMDIKKFDKYPKYLSSMHDIATVKLKDYKKNNDIDLNKIYKFDYSQWTTEKFYDYKIEIPSNTKQIIEEGNNLSHCVASYIDRVLRGETKIIFLRRKGYWSSSDCSLVTLEINNNTLVQARGKCNRDPYKEEINFLKEFCKEKEIAWGLKY